MNKPKIDGAPGLAWRERADGWTARWVCRADLARKGFEPATHRLMHFTADPTQADVEFIQQQCERLQNEMLDFSRGGLPEMPRFVETIGDLIDAYKSDPQSPYQDLRYQTQRSYDINLEMIRRLAGTKALHALNGRNFLAWYDAWRYPKDEPGVDKVWSAYAAITMVRILLSFGIAFEVERPRKDQMGHCVRLKIIITELEFQNGEPRTEAMTAEQAIAIRAEAHRRGRGSIALAQALQFELALRQKDVIGEWVPLAEPGMSDVTRGLWKWLYGVRWEEIDQKGVLTHKFSKSRKNQRGEFNLSLYPMVREELALIPEDQRHGPIVKQEEDGLPWGSNSFSNRWRKIATAAGIPKSVKNMDSRAGATTEAIEATGGDVEAARKQAGHRDAKTTQRYSRGVLKSNSKVALLRAATRPENKA